MSETITETEKRISITHHHHRAADCGVLVSGGGWWTTGESLAATESGLKKHKESCAECQAAIKGKRTDSEKVERLKRALSISRIAYVAIRQYARDVCIQMTEWNESCLGDSDILPLINYVGVQLGAPVPPKSDKFEDVFLARSFSSLGNNAIAFRAKAQDLAKAVVSALI